MAIEGTTVAVADPRQIIDDGVMSTRQWVVVTLMVFLNALDGFDVLSSAFAAPGISAEWNVPRAELGIVLSAELVGMGFGSVLLGSMADRLGRKPTMLLCLVIMAVGMFLAANASDVWSLTSWRFLTGFGIGGMLAAINAVTAETSSRSGRSLAMALMVIGYPLGAMIGGYVAQTWLLVDHDWRAVFMFGAVVTVVMIPLVMLLVPESPAFLAATRPPGALAKINKSLGVFGQPLIDELPPEVADADKPKISDILAKPELRRVTLLLAFGYMFHTITFYYILKWAVQIVSDFGYSQPEAASVLTIANVGGAIGGGLFGFFMKKWDIKRPTIVMLIFSSIAVAAFGIGKETLWGWQMATFCTGFFTNAAIVGYYSAFARGFPAHARATGTGVVLGIGRLGAAGSPLLAGFLFNVLGDDELMLVSGIMALGSIVAMVLLIMLPLRDADRDAMAKQ